MIRSPFKQRPLATRADRSAEFASWAPRARPVAAPTALAVLPAPDVGVVLVQPSTVLGQAHMGRIKAMACVCCRLLGRVQQSITEVHHIRENRQARCDWLTLPMCAHGCHRGTHGVHGDRTYLRQLQMGEFDILAVTLELLEHLR